MSLARSIRSSLASGGARLARTARDIVRLPAPHEKTMLNPLKLNITLPVSKRDHVGRVKPLTQGDITGVAIKIDGAEPIIINTVGTAFGLDGLQQYCDLTPGQHYLQVAVVTKSGVQKFTDSAVFTVGESVDAPVITLE